MDAAGATYVTGSTNSFDFPTVHPLQPTFSGVEDAFVAKLTPDGSALVYSTYLGGNLNDSGSGIAVDSAGATYVTGETNSSNFPSVNALQPTFGGITDAFVAKLTADGSALVYATYLGGREVDEAASIAIDTTGAAYVVGTTHSSAFPTVNALQPTLIGDNCGPGGRRAACPDAFVAKLIPSHIINELVTFIPVESTFNFSPNTSGCPSGFVGQFSFSATLTNNTSSTPVSNLAANVTMLTNGNLLQNADGGPGGVGNNLTIPRVENFSDGVLSPGEFVDVPFSICLKNQESFNFFVDIHVLEGTD